MHISIFGTDFLRSFSSRSNRVNFLLIVVPQMTILNTFHIISIVAFKIILFGDIFYHSLEVKEVKLKIENRNFGYMFPPSFMLRA